MKALVTSKGQVTIPHLIRHKFKIVPGSKLDFEIIDEDTLVVHLVSKDVSELKGIVKSKRRKPASLADMKKAISDGSSK